MGKRLRSHQVMSRSCQLKVGKVDIDSNRDLALRFGIQSITTLLLLKDGEVVHKWVGMQPKPVIQQALDAAAG